MAEIQTPKALIDVARQYGVNLDSTIKYDAEAALHSISAYFNGESDFGFGFPKLKNAVKTAAKKIGPRKPAMAFVVPQGMTPLMALGAADRLLGSTSITNKPQVVRATQALAALGDANAVRGLATLTTVGHIRVKNNVPMGKKAIVNAPPAPAKAVSKPYSKATVFSMAQKKLNDDAKKHADLSLIQKIKKFFGFKL